MSSPWDKFNKSSESNKVETPRWILEGQLNKFHEKLKHTQSQNLPINPYESDTKEIHALYEEKLKPYQVSQVSTIATENFDFVATKGDINLGWKMHLNVIPENVVEVSEYLKSNKYIHKYLSGGDITDGKIFTIYTGSHKITLHQADIISENLSNKLARPKAKSEIELAKGVVGRFVGDRKDFLQYGSAGFSLLKEWIYDGRLWNAANINLEKDATRKANARREGELLALKKLKERYGDYFIHELS